MNLLPWVDVVLTRFRGRIKKDEIQLRECPYCGNPKWNFELNVNICAFHCWACGCHGSARGFFYDHDLDTALLPRTPMGLRVTTPEEEKPVELPKEAVPILQTDKPSAYTALQYLNNRSITRQEIAKYELMYCDSGKYAFRIIWPMRMNGDLVYFAARRYMKKAGRRYDYPSHRRRNLVCVYPGRDRRLTLVMVEGAFQVPNIQRLGYSVMPLLGTAVTNEQRRQLVARNFERYVFLLDHDSVNKSIELASRFRQEGLDSDWAVSRIDSDELEDEELGSVLEGAKPPGIEASVLASLRRL